MATSQESKENRGGHREGSGRKRVSISDKEVQRLLRETRKLEKETGHSTWFVLAAIVHGKIRATVRERIAALKLYAECTITKASESENVSIQKSEPAIYLPEQMPDPAKVVSMQGGKR